ncbi:DNA-3-methyladenine glycosylase [Mycobacteroides salmoniphilum]|uniref:Putative 3-methyladenine DNA glycosylase n=1 Tax=Mycobacteroides salmoniphilum TaxID=404941 RepID=A0A4R8SN64_9MYCO|nr:DNA-3-methyladenine glycosylase [Mycobacteroides salmoniphilum]TDZ90493.1 3-methyladenine DNA glycosylase [Mycobacteroides salmoniphilum]TEA00442.1 3-methyladenine DNA glycosylase [Mycobacteroides salmoniphilum]
MSVEILTTHPVKAALRLLGATIESRGVSAVIVEVEAYGGVPDGPWPDPASHSFRGPTNRNRVMFGPAGHLYVYRSHGIHLCANVVCGPAGIAGGVLMRAGSIVDGVPTCWQRRPTARDEEGLARGPGNLGAALGITPEDNGVDVFSASSPVRLVLSHARKAQSGPRVGVSVAADRPWRFWLPGYPEVSAYRRSPRAPQPETELYA